MNIDKSEAFGVGKQKILEEFLPDRKYIVRVIINWSLIWLGIMLITAATIIPSLIPTGTKGLLISTFSILGLYVLVNIILVIFAFPYYKAINYTLTTQEIVVNRGFLVKRTKIVPYRNITNFVMRRGIIDRILGGDNFGTIQVETAGQGPQQSHPEQRLSGIMNVNEYTEKLRGILSKMKGQAGISADSETASSLDDEEILKKILVTLKEISNKL